MDLSLVSLTSGFHIPFFVFIVIFIAFGTSIKHVVVVGLMSVLSCFKLNVEFDLA